MNLNNLTMLFYNTKVRINVIDYHNIRLLSYYKKHILEMGIPSQRSRHCKIIEP